MSDAEQGWARAFGWSTLGQVAIAVVQLVTSLLLSRLAGPDAYGHFAIVLLVFTVLTLLSDACMQSMVLMGDEAQPPTLFRRGLTFGTTRAVPGFAVLAVAVAIVGHRFMSFTEVLVLVPAVAASTLTQVPRALLLSTGRVRELAASEVVATAVAGGVAIAVAESSADHDSRGLVALLVLTPVLRLVWPLLRTRGELRGDHGGAGLTPPQERTRRALYATNLAQFSGSNFDNVAVGAFLGQVALGFYARAFSLISYPLQQVQLAVGPLALVWISRADEDAFRFIARRTRRVAVPLAVAAAAGTCLLPVLIEAVLGSSWRPSLALVGAMGACTWFRLVMLPLSWAAQTTHNSRLVRALGVIGVLPFAAVLVAAAAGSFRSLAPVFLVAGGPLMLAAASVALRRTDADYDVRTLRLLNLLGIAITLVGLGTVAHYDHWT